MKKISQLTMSIVLCICVGALGGIATATGVNNWYVTLIKPSFNPPNYLFGPVWTLLYFLMGVSLYLILQSPKNEPRRQALAIFFVQLTLNFCWSFLFFKFHWIGVAFIEIVFIWLSILTMIILFKKLNKTAAYLQLPYLAWVSFATVLNGSIWYLNN
jgi:translocator protein